MEENPIAEIDAVLEVFCDSWSYGEDSIYKTLKTNNKDFDFRKMRQIFVKLESDGFIMIDTANTVVAYEVTFEGRLFWQQGGYKGQLNRERRLETQNRRMAKYQKQLQATSLQYEAAKTSDSFAQTQLQRRVATLTGWIAVGTVIAGIYYIVQLYPALNQILDSLFSLFR